MNAPDTGGTGRPKERLHDLLITLILAAIWTVAVFMVWQSDAGIPSSMLAIGSIFFILLLPAMKELVKVLDRWLRRELGMTESDDGDVQGG